MSHSSCLLSPVLSSFINTPFHLTHLSPSVYSLYFIEVHTFPTKTNYKDRKLDCIFLQSTFLHVSCVSGSCLQSLFSFLGKNRLRIRCTIAHPFRFFCFSKKFKEYIDTNKMSCRLNLFQATFLHSLSSFIASFGAWFNSFSGFVLWNEWSSVTDFNVFEASNSSVQNRFSITLMVLHTLLN